jgi:hypothetical protein
MERRKEENNMNDKPLQKLLKLSDKQVERLKYCMEEYLEGAEPTLVNFVRMAVVDSVGEDD